MVKRRFLQLVQGGKLLRVDGFEALSSMFLNACSNMIFRVLLKPGTGNPYRLLGMASLSPTIAAR